MKREIHILGSFKPVDSHGEGLCPSRALLFTFLSGLVPENVLAELTGRAVFNKTV
jgi:hypothetical protein